MNSCQCSKDQTGYFNRACVTMKCQEYKNSTTLLLKCQNSLAQDKVCQFELTNTPYTKTTIKEIENKLYIKRQKKFKN